MSSPAALPPWFGIRTKSNHERVACLMLANKGYTPYLPTYIWRRRLCDRTVQSERPLFPGYFFCRFDPAARLPILTTPGVVAILGCGTEPAPVSDAEIEAIQAVLRSSAHAEPCPYLQEGRRIRVTRGPLENLEGILTKKKSEWRLVVSVTMLQRSVSVEIDRDAVSVL